VAKSPSVALDASLPDSCANAFTEIGVSFDRGWWKGGELGCDGQLLNELLYNNPLATADTPLFITFRISEGDNC
jgi:hypothetical protein